MEFKQLQFGKASAEREAAEEPELLLRGYFDPHNIPSALLRGKVFLVLGPKGSGKSSITEYLRLMAKSNSELFVRREELKDFPFREFAAIKAGGATSQARYPGAWSWLLLLSAFASFSEDQGAESNRDSDFRETLRVLAEEGFLPTPSLREVVLRSFKTTITLKLPVLEGAAEEARARSGLHLFSAVETLRKIAANFHTESTHLITIDGLDEIFIHDQIQWDTIAALILEIDRLNAMFAEHNVPARIAVLCRTDVFERLPLADANKIRQDSGVTLNWYPATGRAQDSHLLDLAENKASVRYPEVGDIVGRYFPASIRLDRGRVSTHRYLMDRTRHTPRDYLRLLTYIQATAPPFGGLSDDDIYTGARRYCIDYFIPEIRNELVGLLSREEARGTVGLLSTMRKTRFGLAELERKAKADSRYRHLKVAEAASQLFTCGAIGNEAPRAHGPFRNFRYMNPEVNFDPSQPLVMHPALAIGLNIRSEVTELRGL